MKHRQDRSTGRPTHDRRVLLRVPPRCKGCQTVDDHVYQGLVVEDRLQTQDERVTVTRLADRDLQVQKFGKRFGRCEAAAERGGEDLQIASFDMV